VLESLTVRAGVASGGQAGSGGDGVSTCSDCVRADTANGGGGVSQKESKGWCDRRVTKEEEVLASQDQRLVKVIPKTEYLIMYAFN
jgi:hypothetical protein